MIGWWFLSQCSILVLVGRSRFHLMAGLDDLWSHFYLIEEEEGGAKVPRQEVAVIHHLEGKFFTKRVVNVDAVAWTFKHL